jgi:hypothetical protein
MRTGHRRLADGSLLRIDIELGRFVGSLYTRDMRVKKQVVGSEVEVHAWAGRVHPPSGATIANVSHTATKVVPPQRINPDVRFPASLGRTG